MKFAIFDCGYLLVCIHNHKVLFKLRFPLPLTWHSWRYLLRRWLGRR